MESNFKNLNYNIDNTNMKNNINNSSSISEFNLEVSSNKNNNEENIKDIVENFIQKKLLKENEHKYQIERTKKSVLEKFYSLTNNDYINQQNKNKLLEAEYNFNQQINNIPQVNQNQKEYDEMREKYKNERNKKKSSIFKSEDLHISNTDIVHIKKEDYSPINPNAVDIENKNNIFIIQKKLFGENNEDEEENGPKEKIEDIDEIELDFSEINNNKYEESEIVCSNYKNYNNESEKKETNKIYNNDININYFTNEILVEKREINLCFIMNKPNKNLNGIYNFLKQKKRSKNYSIQLVSSIGYLKNNLTNNIINNKIRDKNSFSNNINDFKHENNENNIKMENILKPDYLRNNKLIQNFATDSNFVNGNINNIKDNSDNDNSNNTIVQINNNNNYNGKYYVNDNKIINGSTYNDNYNNINHNNPITKNKYLKEYKVLNNKNKSFKNNISYLDYKNFSGRFSQKRINEEKNIYLEKIVKKPKIIKKKNNSFILNREMNLKNNKIINKSNFQTNNNKNMVLINNNANNKTGIVKSLLNYDNTTNNGNVNNKIIPIISKMPISIKVKKNIFSKMSKRQSQKENIKKIGNKIALLNTLLNNNSILFQNVQHQREAIEKLKSRPNNGVYFIYVDKINEGYSFKGIYKRGASEVNHICNKIYGIPNTPLMLSYEKFYILVEKEDKNFDFRKLRDINVFSFVKTILLIKNK